MSRILATLVILAATAMWTSRSAEAGACDGELGNLVQAEMVVAGECQDFTCKYRSRECPNLTKKCRVDAQVRPAHYIECSESSPDTNKCCQEHESWEGTISCKCTADSECIVANCTLKEIKKGNNVFRYFKLKNCTTAGVSTCGALVKLSGVDTTTSLPGSLSWPSCGGDLMNCP